MNTFTLILSLLFVILCINAEEVKTGAKTAVTKSEGKKAKGRKFAGGAKGRNSFGGQRKKARCPTALDINNRDVGLSGCYGRKLTFKLKFKMREIVCGQKTKETIQFANLDKTTVNWVQSDNENLKGKKMTAQLTVDGATGTPPTVTFEAYRVAKDFSDDNGEHIEGDFKWSIKIKDWPWKDRAKNCLKFCVGYNIKEKDGRKRTRDDVKEATPDEKDSKGKVRFWQKFNDFAIESPDGSSCGVNKLRTKVIASNDENDDEDDATTKAESDKIKGRLRTCYQFTPCQNAADELVYDPEISEEEGDTTAPAASVAGMLARGNLLIGLLVAAFYFF